MILIEKITIGNSKQKRTFDKLLHCIQESTLYGFQINIAFRKLPDSERTFENLQKLKLDNLNSASVFSYLPDSERTFENLQKLKLDNLSSARVFPYLPDSERTFENFQKLKLDNSNFSTLITVFASLPKSEQEKEMHTLSHIINGLINDSIQFFYDKIDFGKKLKSAITKSKSQNQSKSNHTKDEINR